jgi:chromosomal replication initiation ATPase DnaA
MTIGLDPALRFSGLVTGAGNQLAVSAARAVAESAQPPFNPLLVQGGAGLGKTHLLHAIGHLRLEVEPRAVVRLASWTDLVEGWRAAAASRRATEFLLPPAEAGLLLIDDAQPAHDDPEARAAILAMLEGRVAAMKSTVLGSRHSLTMLAPPDDPSARVLRSGLVVELGRPDAAMRWEILYRKSAEAGIDLSAGVLEEIAALPFESIRDLVGAANRLVAFQSVSAVALAPSQARVLITGVLDEAIPDAGVPAEVAEPPRPVLEPRAPLTVEDTDEFGTFLSDVVASVSQQVDQWRGRIADAMLRWQGEGYHVARLQALLDQELPSQPETLLRRFEEDLEQLRRLEAEAREVAPDLAGHEAFRDPDQIERAEQLLEEARVRDLASSQPLTHYRLEELVEGASNRLAFGVARGVGEEPGAGPNPLLIVGEAGVGKTHLLHAIGNALLAQGQRGVVCVGAHAFEAAVEEANKVDGLVAWRRRFRWAGALLIDDVHLLAGRGGVQDELSTLLDLLLSTGRQVAFTSAVPVAELSGLSPQLLSRLASGIVVEVPRPDREVRLGIIRRLLSATEAGDDAALVEYLASRPVDSVRALHALVQRVLRASEGGRTPLGHALARQILETPARVTPSRPATARPGTLGASLLPGRLREKLVEHWPMPADRLIEDFR